MCWNEKSNGIGMHPEFVAQLKASFFLVDTDGVPICPPVDALRTCH